MKCVKADYARAADPTSKLLLRLSNRYGNLVMDLNRMKFLSMYHSGNKLFAQGVGPWDILRNARSGGYLYEYNSQELEREIQIYRPSISSRSNSRRFWARSAFYISDSISRIIYCCDLEFSAMKINSIESIVYFKNGASELGFENIYLNSDEHEAVVRYVMDKKI